MKLAPLLIVGLFILVSISCKKAASCETWEVVDNCTSTGNCYYVGCNIYPSGTHQVQVCGDDLKDARENNTVTINDNCVNRTRTFLRKL